MFSVFYEEKENIRYSSQISVCVLNTQTKNIVGVMS